MRENRPKLDDPRVLAALAHPVRMDVLGYLMGAGPATASACARAVGDTPSNCSYHLRVLAGHGLVEAGRSADGRERPWRATITGFDIDEDATDPETAARTDELAAAALQLDYQLAREALRGRSRLPEEWARAGTHASFGLRVTPAELAEIARRIDAVVRPYIAATREDAPEGADYAQLSMTAFARPGFGGRR